MDNLLTLAAGPMALKHIREHGLRPDDVGTIFGASGAAKWLAIAGLDKAIFGDWMAGRTNPTPIDLYGTSVGAFKLAAAARHAPSQALATLAQAYIAQSYETAVTPEAIAAETRKTLMRFLGDGTPAGVTQGVLEILTNPRYHLHIGAVRAHGLLNSNMRGSKQLALTRAFVRAMTGRSALRGMGERTVFSDPRSRHKFHAQDTYPVNQRALTAQNFFDALRASGTIPIYMQPVRFADDRHHGYLDGGLLDYHPVPGNFWPKSDHILLYPHFYEHFKIRWFDKFAPWRKAGPRLLENVVMVTPSAGFIRSLPDAKLPSRQDFTKYRRREHLRFDKWQQIVKQTDALGETFIELCKSGDIAAHIRPL
jgi:predicted acylesterase/phospholipase RssA